MFPAGCDKLLEYIRWGRGAVGSAPRWHRGGRGFESPRLHQSKTVRAFHHRGHREHREKRSGEESSLVNGALLGLLSLLPCLLASLPRSAFFLMISVLSPFREVRLEWLPYG